MVIGGVEVQEGRMEIRGRGRKELIFYLFSLLFFFSFFSFY